MGKKSVCVFKMTLPLCNVIVSLADTCCGMSEKCHFLLGDYYFCWHFMETGDDIETLSKNSIDILQAAE